VPCALSKAFLDLLEPVASDLGGHQGQLALPSPAVGAVAFDVLGLASATLELGLGLLLLRILCLAPLAGLALLLLAVLVEISEAEQHPAEDGEHHARGPVDLPQLTFEVREGRAPATVDEPEASAELLAVVHDGRDPEKPEAGLDGGLGVAEQVRHVLGGQLEAEELAGLEGGAGSEQAEDAAEDVGAREIYTGPLGEVPHDLVAELPGALAGLVAGLELEGLQASELLDAHPVAPQPHEAGWVGLARALVRPVAGDGC